MHPWEILLIAVVLGLDSFASSVAIGITMSGLDTGQTLRLSSAYLLAHVVMILVGYAVGLTIIRFVDAVDHWIAFALLFMIGVKFIYEGFRSNGGSVNGTYDPTKGKLLMGLAVATSIDAFVIGGTLPSLGFSPLPSAALVGVIVFAMTFIGTKAYRVVGRGVSRYSDIVGGLVLIALGIKIILEHIGIF